MESERPKRWNYNWKLQSDNGITYVVGKECAIYCALGFNVWVRVSNEGCTRISTNKVGKGKHVDAMLSYAVNPMFTHAVGFCGTLQCKYLHIAKLNVCTGYNLTVDISGICNISAWASQHPALPRCDWQLVWWSSTWCHLPRCGTY